MQLKQVAELLGVDHKEVAKEVEDLRDEFTTKGYKLAKKLSATSSLEEDLVRDLLARLDMKRQKSVVAEKEAEDRRRREEDERRRAADELERQKHEAERKAREEEARKRTEAELARKQAEIKAAEEAKARRDVEEAAKRAAAEEERAANAVRIQEERRVAQEAAAAAAAAAAAPPPPPPPPPPPAPPAPQAAAPVPAPHQPPGAPPRQRINSPGGPMGTGPAAGGFRPASPQSPSGPRPAGGPGSYDRGPRPPQGDRPPREGGYENRGPRPQQGDRPPREGGYENRGPRPAGPGGFDRGPRPAGPGGFENRGPRPAGPGGYDRGGPRPQGDRPPREGGYENRGPRPQGDRGGPRPAGPGGYERGPRPGGPAGLDRGGPRPPGDRGPRPGGPGGYDRGPRPGGGFDRGGGRPGEDRGGRPASKGGIEDFIKSGIPTGPGDEFTKTSRSRPIGKDKAPKKPADRPDEGGKVKRLKGGEDSRRIRPSQLFNVEAGISGSDRAAKLRKKSQQRGDSRVEPQPAGPKVVHFDGDFTVGEFAEKTGIPLPEVMKRLLLRGDMLTINQLLDPDTAEELAIDFEIEIKIERESDEADVATFSDAPDAPEDLRPRPPIVTIMGHVDHGKTTLLDKIRKADVASGEFGGITQHIGAYHVTTKKGDIVFLDTPGHEAFTEMRSRGANVTDVVVLVVAANDGVMPQTVEAINHAKAAEVPIIVAINKVDVNGANPDRVMTELMSHGLVPEQYGGEVPMLPVSALTGQGLDDLLEYIALQTEIMELKANPNRAAEGTVVESHVDPLRGAVATILVERGTLRVGDVFVCGTEFGRVRAMRDDRDKQLDEAGPAMPVEILGLRGSPVAGEQFIVVPTENDAREIAERRSLRRRSRSAISKPHVSLDNLADRLAEGEVLTLNLIVKGDVQGSVEAIKGALLKIKSDKVALRILHAAVGAVSASDVQLADASEAIILGFNVGVDPAARDLAEETGVDVRSYQIIYALLEDMEKAMLGLLKPEFSEKEEGRALVQQTFKVSKVGTVAGCIVKEGTVAIDHQARLLRNGTIVWRGKLRSLRRVKDEARQVLAGVECGVGLENFNDIKEGDIIETYSLVQKAVSLVTAGEESKR